MSEEVEVEEVDFVITISAEHWDKKPMFSITLNDEEVINPQEFDLPNGEEKKLVFSKSLPASDESDCVLKINLLNKEPTDTKKDNYDDPDNYEIVADMLLIVNEIEIDGISLPVGSDYIIDSDSVGYYSVNEPVEYRGEPNTTKIPGCTTMGWNGSYCYEFKTPIYLWLLDQIS